MATSVKLYPIKGHYLSGVPATVQVVDTKAEAQALIETGAFTDNARHPDRDHEALDSTKPPPEAEPESTEGPPDGGPLDSTTEV
jgi:hypothetical protein